MVGATLKFVSISHNMFCFVNKRRTQIKVLYWQRSGFCLWHAGSEGPGDLRSRNRQVTAAVGAKEKLAPPSLVGGGKHRRRQRRQRHQLPRTSFEVLARLGP
jgi:transposase